MCYSRKAGSRPEWSQDNADRTLCIKRKVPEIRAYVHLHGIKTHAKDVVVAGKKHKVKHSGKKMKKR